MAFLIGLIQTLLDSISGIYRTKAVRISKVSKGIFSLHGEFVGWIFFIVFLLFGVIEYKAFLDVKIFGLMFIIMGLETIAFFINQDLYKENKVAYMLPFENLKYLFSILLGFILFHDASIESFVISIIAVITLILFNIDYKDFKLPKSLSKIVLSQLIFGINTILLAFILKTYSGFTVAAMDVTASTIILLLFTVKFSELKQLTKQPKEFYINRYISAFVGRSGYVIGLFLIADLGVELATLLKFLGIGTTLVLSYLILGEKPNKKDVILAVLMVVMVSVGLYFNEY